MANKSIFKPNPFSTWDLTKQDAFSAVRLSDAITVDGNDLLLTYVDGELSSEIRMSLSSGKLTLSGQNGIINEVELPDEDTILKSADYDNETKEIVLVFETKDGQETPMRINVADLVDEYTAGNGLKLDEKEFSINEEIVATVAGVEAVKTELEGKIENKLDASTYNDEKAAFETVEHAEETYQPKGDYLTEHQDLSEYAKTTDVEEKLDEKQDKGDYVEYSDYQGRKTIRLKNYDSISGVKTDGTGVNIAMVSKWDCVDLGSTQLPIILNGSKDRPLYNDDKELALLSDVPSVDEFINDVEYLSDENKIVFKHGDSEIASIDTTDFVKDGMIDGVEIKDGNLEITFNEASGKETIKLSISDIFNADNYYTKNDVDTKVGEVEAKIPSLEGYVKEEKLNEYTPKSDYDQTHANVETLIGEVAELEADKIDSLTNTNGLIIKKLDVAEGGEGKKNRVVEIGVDEDKVVTWSEYSGQEGRKILKLAHRDPIAGASPKGGSQIAMVSDYDGLDYPVVELGGTKAAMVLNSNDKPVKVELTENGKRVQHVVATIDDLVDFAKTSDVTEEINKAVETKQDKGDYVEYKEFDGGRKTINLRNRDTIASEGAQIAMVSTYDGLNFPVLELGGTKAAMVLNTCEDRVKVEVVEEGKRVQHSVATLDDLNDFPKYEPYVNGDINKKTIVLENDDNISGKRTDGLGVNLIEVSRWNVADISSKSVHTNLNGMYERPTYNDKEGIALLSDIEKVKTEMKSYVDALLKNYTLKSDEDIAKIVKAGGEVVLPKDVKAESGFTLTKDANIDLNGHALDAVSNGQYGDNVILGNNCDVKILNGRINEAANASQANASAVILIKTSGETHVTLENVEATGGRPVYLNNSNPKTTVTINGGKYSCNGENGEAIYVQKGGQVIIESGYFENPAATTYKGFLLNIKDDFRQTLSDPREAILVKGGTFANFDPSNNGSEGPGTSYVADGYHVESKQEGDNILYTVVKDSE